MEYYTATEVVISAMYSILFGAAMAVFYIAFPLVANSLKMIFAQIKDACSKSISFGMILSRIKEKKSNEISLEVFNFFSDFTVTLVFGIGFSILSYIVADGAVRIYILFISLAAFYICLIPLKKFLLSPMLKLLFALSKIISFALSLVLLAIRRLISGVLSKVITPVLFSSKSK